MESVRSTKDSTIMTWRYERSFESAPTPASESPSNCSSFLERTCSRKCREAATPCTKSATL